MCVTDRAQIIFGRILPELNLANMAVFFYFFSKTVVTHMPAPRKILLRKNDATEIFSLFLFLFFLLGVDTHLKVARFPQPHLAGFPP